MGLHAYLMTAILTWTGATSPDDVAACEELARVIEQATVVRLPYYSTRSASAIRLFATAAFESPLVANKPNKIDHPSLLQRFVNMECPKPFSCDGGIAHSPWQMHLELTSLEQSAKMAYSWLAFIPGAWTTWKASSDWTNDYLKQHPPPEDEEYQLPEYPLVIN